VLRPGGHCHPSKAHGLRGFLYFPCHGPVLQSPKRNPVWSSFLPPSYLAGHPCWPLTPSTDLQPTPFSSRKTQAGVGVRAISPGPRPLPISFSASEPSNLLVSQVFSFQLPSSSAQTPSIEAGHPELPRAPKKGFLHQIVNVLLQPRKFLTVALLEGSLHSQRTRNGDKAA